MTSNERGLGLKTDHVLVTPNGNRLAVLAMPRGQEARREFDGAMIPGPWADTFGKCTVIDNHGGTGVEMARLDEAGKVHHVQTGDLLSIDGNTYRVRVFGRDHIRLEVSA